jgi:hypothetical protein
MKLHSGTGSGDKMFVDVKLFKYAYQLEKLLIQWGKQMILKSEME